MSTNTVYNPPGVLPRQPFCATKLTTRHLLNTSRSVSLSDTSSASEDEGSLRRQAALSAVLAQSLQSPDYWINRSVQSSSTSSSTTSSTSSTLSHGENKTPTSALADILASTRIGATHTLCKHTHTTHTCMGKTHTLQTHTHIGRTNTAKHASVNPHRNPFKSNILQIYRFG